MVKILELMGYKHINGLEINLECVIAFNQGFFGVKHLLQLSVSINALSFALSKNIDLRLHQK